MPRVPSSGRGPAAHLWALLALAAALRLALLPAFAHPDLLSMQDRARLVLEGTHTPDDFSLQALPVALHAAWAGLTDVALPDMGGVPWPGPTEEQVFAEARRQWRATDAATLAVWKLPYLLADLGLGLVLLALVPRSRRAVTLALWAVHPFALYASVAFAKHEAWMLLPLALGLVALRAGRLERGFAWVGLAIALRLYPLLLLPAMVAAADDRPRRRMLLAALACAPTCGVLAASGLAARGVAPGLAFGGVLLLGAGAVLARAAAARAGRAAPVDLALGLAALALAPVATESLLAADSPLWSLLHHVTFLFGGLGPGRPDGLWWFGIAMLAVLFAAGARARARRSEGSGHGERAAARAGEDVVDAALAAGLVFFSLAYFHPQYTALLMLLVLARWHRVAAVAPLHALQVVGVLLLLFGFRDGHATFALALPLGPELAAPLLGAPSAWPAPLGDVPWPAVGRALLVVAAAGMVRSLARRPPDETAPAGGALGLGLALFAWPATAAAAVLLADPAAARGLGQAWLARLQPSGAVGAALGVCLAAALVLGLVALGQRVAAGSPDGGARRGGDTGGQ